LLANNKCWLFQVDHYYCVPSYAPPKFVAEVAGIVPADFHPAFPKFLDILAARLQNPGGYLRPTTTAVIRIPRKTQICHRQNHIIHFTGQIVSERLLALLPLVSIFFTESILCNSILSSAKPSLSYLGRVIHQQRKGLRLIDYPRGPQALANIILFFSILKLSEQRAIPEITKRILILNIALFVQHQFKMYQLTDHLTSSNSRLLSIRFK